MARASPFFGLVLPKNDLTNHARGVRLTARSPPLDFSSRTCCVPSPRECTPSCKILLDPSARGEKFAKIFLGLYMTSLGRLAKPSRLPL
jgi:hypothetical protein